MPQTGTCSWIQNSKPPGRSQVTSTTAQWHAGRPDPPRLEFWFEKCYNPVSLHSLTMAGLACSPFIRISERRLKMNQKQEFDGSHARPLLAIPLWRSHFPPGTLQCPWIARARYNLVLWLPWQRLVSPNFRTKNLEHCPVMTNHRQGFEDIYARQSEGSAGEVIG